MDPAVEPSILYFLVIRTHSSSRHTFFLCLINNGAVFGLQWRQFFVFFSIFSSPIKKNKDQKPNPAVFTYAFLMYYFPKKIIGDMVWETKTSVATGLRRARRTRGGATVSKQSQQQQVDHQFRRTHKNQQNENIIATSVLQFKACLMICFLTALRNATSWNVSFK